MVGCELDRFISVFECLKDEKIFGFTNKDKNTFRLTIAEGKKVDALKHPLCISDPSEGYQTSGKAMLV